MAEKNIGSLAQKYAEIIMGFLTQAIIQFQAIRQEQQKTGGQNNLIIQPENVQSFIGRIEQAFGDLKLDDKLQANSAYPIISWLDIYTKFRNYLLTVELPLEQDIFSAVIRDFLKLKILVPKLVTKQDSRNPLYEINILFFNQQQIEQSCLNLRETLEQKLFKFISNEEAREILLHMSLLKSMSKDEISYYSQNFPSLRSTIFVNSRFGRGYLLWALKNKGIKYRPFMKATKLLLDNNLLLEGCDDFNQEYLMLNPLLKPFSVIAELIRALKQKEVKAELLELESSQENITPFGSMISIPSFNADVRDFYLFESFEIGLQGL